MSENVSIAPGIVPGVPSLRYQRYLAALTKPPSLVYFIQGALAPLIKIGSTAGAVSVRLNKLQGGSPDKLKLLGVMDGDVEVEMGLHRRFAHLAEHGEWFRPANDLLRFISDTAMTMKALQTIHAERAMKKLAARERT